MWEGGGQGKGGKELEESGPEGEAKRTTGVDSW